MKVIRRKDKRLELLEDLVIKTDRISNLIKFKNDWLEIADGVITIKKKFHWNGCTWARDGKRDEHGIPESWIASCVHDALCTVYIPEITINVKNLIFYDELVKIKFKWLGIPACTLYYLGVSVGVPLKVLFIGYSS